MNYILIEGVRKNSNIFWCGDYGYIKDYIYKDSSLHLKCRNSGFEFKCKGRAKIVLPITETSILVQVKPHTYESNESEKDVLIAKTSLKRKAECTTTALREIFEDEISKNENLSTLMTFPEVTSSMHKRRRNNYPANPKSPSEALLLLESRKNPFDDIYLGSAIFQDEIALIFGNRKVLERVKALQEGLC